MPAAKEKTGWDTLRKPFDKSQVGKLPRGGIQLDYVGHANVTDRLLEADPTWTWEPMAFDEQGLPLFTTGTDQFNKPLKQLWIRLTVLGVTRPGVGDGKSEKECIGDAIRNAAMRFGVALDLWSKEELGSQHEPVPEVKPTIDPPAPEEPAVDIHEDVKSPGQQLLDSINELKAKFSEMGYKDPASKVSFVRGVLDKPTPSTVEEYRKVINALNEPF